MTRKPFDTAAQALPTQDGAATYARIIIASPLRDPLIYRIPDELRAQVVPGMRVVVPLGKRQITGVVLELLDETQLADVREIIALQDERPVLDATLLQLTQWMARYYLTNLGEVLGTILPPSLRGESVRTIVAGKGIIAGVTPLEEKILQAIHQNNGKIGIKGLRRVVPGALHSVLERLQSKGAVEIRERWPAKRRRLAGLEGEPSAGSADPKFAPAGEQQSVLATIGERFDKGGFETFLLHGVTGSGKTEVYLRVMERVRQLGRRSLILTPEISLTPQLTDRLNARFPGRVGILHSALTAAERSSYWWRIARGDVDVVVGARSAVFAPLPDLGALIVDEEHDPSYKQEEGLKYNGRDIAVIRGKLSNCPVILGSATPAVESYYNCLQGRYRLLEMRHRVQERHLPAIEMIDLRWRRKAPPAGSRAGPAPTPCARHGDSESGFDPWISDRFAELLKQNYENSRQSLIFLNRRGFSSFLQCTTCGHVLRCSYCSVTLTLHRDQHSLCCHHCNFRRPASEICPACGDPSLSGMGVGTEQIEKSVHRLVPDARVARMDRDTTVKRGSHETLIRAWERGEIDILVGTQMITKGHDVTGVTLVGALLADLSLNLPDFRAAERTFQLLTQVAGRSGRGDHPGRVVIQTYSPDHYAMKHLTLHDYKGFFGEEIEFRRALNYPPFSRLINLRIDGPKPDQVEKAAKALRKRLGMTQRAAAKFRDIEILGPAPAPIQKLRNRYRWQLLLKGGQTNALLELAQHAREHLPRARATRLHVDVDPYNML